MNTCLPSAAAAGGLSRCGEGGMRLASCYCCRAKSAHIGQSMMFTSWWLRPGRSMSGLRNVRRPAASLHQLIQHYLPYSPSSSVGGVGGYMFD